MSRKGGQKSTSDASVAVVGAGIIGLSAALHLLERGFNVTLYERSGIGAGASGIQPGGVRQQWGTRANCLMAKESFAFYRDFPASRGTLAQATLDPCGYIFVANIQATLDRFREHVTLQNGIGIPSRILTPAEAAEIAPSLNPEAFTGAAYCAEDGYFDRPQSVVEAFAELVTREGGRLEITDVRALEPNGAGWSLALGDGANTTVDAVVVAAGYDSPTLLAPLGIDLPIIPEPRYLFFSDHIRDRLLDPLVIAVDRGLATKHLADGRVLASFLGAVGSPETEQDAWRRHIREVVVDLLPVLEFVPLPLLAAGYYDMTPDGQPIVGALTDGLWIAAGFSGHGFMVAPAVGRMLADAIDRRSLPEWADAVSVERLSHTLAEAEGQVI
jgi:sarcosine oxidase subunit beta